MVSKIYIRWFIFVVTAIFITGCSKGMDRKPDITSLEKYQAQLLIDFKEVPEEKVAAYNWAVRGQSLDSIKENYSGKSYLQISKAELEKEITSTKSEITELNKVAAEFEPVIAELRKIKVEVSDAGPSNDAMSRGFAFNAHINNGSRFDFSSLEWDTALYLDGATDPVATGSNLSIFDDKGGLKAGQSVVDRMTQETFFSKDWDTLAVKNAKQRRVVLTLRDAKDFSNKSFLAGSPFERLNKLKSILAATEKQSNVLTN